MSVLKKLIHILTRELWVSGIDAEVDISRYFTDGFTPGRPTSSEYSMYSEGGPGHKRRRLLPKGTPDDIASALLPDCLAEELRPQYFLYSSS